MYYYFFVSNCLWHLLEPFRKKRKILLQLIFGEAWDEIVNRIENRKSLDLHPHLHLTKYSF